MLSRGSASNGRSPPQENVVMHNGGSISHPRMFRNRGNSLHTSDTANNVASHQEVIPLSMSDLLRETNLSHDELLSKLKQNGVSIDYLYRLLNNNTHLKDILKILDFSKPVLSISDVMSATNQSYNELVNNLESKDLSLSDLLELLNKNASLQEVLQMLALTDDDVETLATQTEVSTLNWDDLEHQTFIGKDENATLPTSTYYSDPIYAAGVHPVHDEVPNNSVVESFISNEQDTFINEIEDSDVNHNQGHARIHSFTVQEIPWQGNNVNMQSDILEYFSPDDENYLHTDDPTYWEDISVDTNDEDTLLPSSSNSLLIKDKPSWGYKISEESFENRPLTITVIAASAIMGGLAIFTLFILIAYTIVKCTKKPALNNYKVTNKETGTT